MLESDLCYLINASLIVLFVFDTMVTLNIYWEGEGGKEFIIIRADEFPDRFWMGIIEDASGPSPVWKMVVIWLDEGRWGPPPRPEQTGAQKPRADCINEQAVLKGTGCCNADEWSLQSRDGRWVWKGTREGGGEVGTEAAVVVWCVCVCRGL